MQYLKCPIVSHSHEGIRVNIDGVVDQFGTAVSLAETYAKHKCRCQLLAEPVGTFAEAVAKGIRDESPFEDGKGMSVQLHDDIQDLLKHLGELMNHCRR